MFFFVISCSVLNNFHGFDEVQKNGTRYFYQPSVWESLEILNALNILTLKQIFLKSKTFFKKLEYRFLVQNNRIKNLTFPYETALSEANVKTNTIGKYKGWTSRKEQSFASRYLGGWYIKLSLYTRHLNVNMG